MHYEFDGYSEASNSPGRAAAATRAQGGGQNRDQRQDRNNNRSNGNDGNSNQYPDGFYRGTGRFARENFETEQRERGQQQQRTFGASPYRSAAFEYMDTGGRGRSEAEWGRVFMEAFRRRAGGGGGGGGGMGERESYGGGGGGGYEPRGYGAEREMGYEEFLSGVFGGGRFGPEADGYGYGYGYGYGSGGGGGGVGVSFEEMFGPPPGFGEGPSSPGAGGGYGGGGPGPRRGADDQNERDRRGGAGMTRDEFDNMFRARFEGPSINGYASGPPPADLFDRWYTDW
ncbi:hypothetical protein CKAH01_11925 [Colletotrichum kahawae]|uniref:Uncharacterized protein n=1 Tax=Colletotrichum kahawae TaxID=34407 RepID=A0AAE0DBS3_COLKA|nr:hypothetical protein CKAH01_11925 [Colletotrichum kahawae]